MFAKYTQVSFHKSLRFTACTITATVFLLIISFGSLSAVEPTAPSQDRWSPVEAQLNAGDDNAAISSLNSIVNEFPNWPHGWLKRAEVNERLENMNAAISDSQKAYDLDPKAEDIASTHARLLVRQERYPDAIEVLKTYLPQPDRKGWVHYYAAEAAFRLGQLDQANGFITLGVKNLDANIPPEFRFLSGRIMEQRGDVE